MVGSSLLGQAVTVMAGAGLVGLGGLRMPTRPGRWLVGAAGAGWLAAEWANPAAPEAVIFTIGLVCSGAFLPLFMAGALPGRAGRIGLLRPAAVVIAGAAAVLTGPISAAVADPRQSGCPDCPADLVAFAGGGSADALVRIAAAVAATACLLAVALTMWRGDRARTPRYPTGTVTAVLTCAATDSGVLAAIGPGSSPGHATHAVLALAIIGFVAAEARAGWLARRALQTVARATLLSSTVEPPQVETLLREALGDVGLRVLYPVGEGWVDRSGVVVDAGAPTTTLLTDGGVTLAAVTSAPGRTPDAEVMGAVLDRARLHLDVERIQAGERVRVAELSTARHLAAGAAYVTRVGLERDLHDGAQQRLVALRFTLGLLRSLGDRLGTPSVVAAADEADAATQVALTQLRDLAHGMAASSLRAVGLVEAVRGVTERSGALFLAEGWDGAEGDEHRVSPLAGWIAYSVVAEQVKPPRDRGGPVEVVLRRDKLSIGVIVRCGSRGFGDASGSPMSPVLADQVALVGGRFSVSHGPAQGGSELTVVLPCE